MARCHTTPGAICDLVGGCNSPAAARPNWSNRHMAPRRAYWTLFLLVTWSQPHSQPVTHIAHHRALRWRSAEGSVALYDPRPLLPQSRIRGGGYCERREELRKPQVLPPSPEVYRSPPKQ